MRLSGLVILEWGDGEYQFKLGGREIAELEKACGAPIGLIANRMFRNECSYVDIKSTVILGLEGGGKTPLEAKRLWDRFCEGWPIANPLDPSSPLKTAVAVMEAAWFGVEDLKLPGNQTAEADYKAFDMDQIRAKCVEFGIDPKWADNASIREILGTFEKLAKPSGDAITPEKYEEMKMRLAEKKARMGLN